MKLPNNRRAVSPIIATLLLIAIAVASGVIVYVFTGSLAGNLTKNGGSQITEQMQMLAYDFTGRNDSGLTGQALVLYIGNTGSSATVSAVYFDGVALTQYGLTSGYYGDCTSASTKCTTPSAGNSFEMIPTADTVAFTGTIAAGRIDISGTAPNVGLQNIALTQSQQTVLVLTLTAAQTAGSSHSVKVVTTNGGNFAFSVVAGSTG